METRKGWGKTIFDNTPSTWHGDKPFIGVVITEFEDAYVIRKETIDVKDERQVVSVSEPVLVIKKGE